MRRSGITSRSKWASFSKNQTSCNNCGPLGPAVITFWLSTTGQPALVVSFFLSLIVHTLFCVIYIRRSIQTGHGNGPSLDSHDSLPANADSNILPPNKIISTATNHCSHVELLVNSRAKDLPQQRTTRGQRLVFGRAWLYKMADDSFFSG